MFSNKKCCKTKCITALDFCKLWNDIKRKNNSRSLINVVHDCKERIMELNISEIVSHGDTLIIYFDDYLRDNQIFSSHIIIIGVILISGATLNSTRTSRYPSLIPTTV